MIRPRHLLALAFALSSTPAAAGWTCDVHVALGQFDGGVGRRLDDAGVPERGYLMQLTEGGSPNRRMVVWNILAADARRGRRGEIDLPALRPEATAFAEGPGYVSITYRWSLGVAGPVWAYFYGDGRLVGQQMISTARQVRHARGWGASGLAGGLGDPAILARLAPARDWTVIATDGAGREIHRETFRIPGRDEAAAAFARARAEIDRMVADYARACQEDEPLEATI